ncbi:Uncharacterised protein [Segatella copri]|nr:Uncharacterised protein [Segatella copri]
MMFWKTPVFERSLTGMLKPHCSIYCNNPTVFRQTDLPPAFGPEMIRMRLSCVSMISNGTTFSFFFCRDSCNNGCIARVQSMCGWSSTSGSMALKISASFCLACIRSMMARKR